MRASTEIKTTIKEELLREILKEERDFTTFTVKGNVLTTYNMFEHPVTVMHSADFALTCKEWAFKNFSVVIDSRSAGLDDCKDEPIATARAQYWDGIAPKELCRKHGINEVTAIILVAHRILEVFRK